MKTSTKTAAQIISELEKWNANQPAIKAKLFNDLAKWTY